MSHKYIVIGLGALLLSACVSTKTPQELKAMPDSYFMNKPYLTHEEEREWAIRKGRQEAEQRRQAMCIFGSSPIIDRDKLNCHNVKGSPEYKKASQSVLPSPAKSKSEHAPKRIRD